MVRKGSNRENVPNFIEHELGNPDDRRTVSLLTRIMLVARDRQVQEGVIAGLRTVTNAGISLADIPSHYGLWIGELASWSADALKIFSRITGLKAVDLTPDVSLRVALLSEGLEVPTGGHFASHAIEGFLQWRHDRGKIARARARVGEIWRGEIDDYRKNMEEINEAIDVFS